MALPTYIIYLHSLAISGQATRYRYGKCTAEADVTICFLDIVREPGLAEFESVILEYKK